MPKLARHCFMNKIDWCIKLIYEYCWLTKKLIYRFDDIQTDVWTMLKVKLLLRLKNIKLSWKFFSVSDRFVIASNPIKLKTTKNDETMNYLKTRDRVDIFKKYKFVNFWIWRISIFNSVNNTARQSFCKIECKENGV